MQVEKSHTQLKFNYNVENTLFVYQQSRTHACILHHIIFILFEDKFYGPGP